MTKKSRRQAELEEERIRLFAKLRVQFESACDSHNQRQVSKMKQTLERMLATIVELLDPQPNDDKRKQVFDAIHSAALADVVMHEDGEHNLKNNPLYIHGTFDLDKLVSSLVWLRNDPEIDLVQLEQSIVDGDVDVPEEMP